MTSFAKRPCLDIKSNAFKKCYFPLMIKMKSTCRINSAYQNDFSAQKADNQNDFSAQKSG